MEGEVREAAVGEREGMYGEKREGDEEGEI